MISEKTILTWFDNLTDDFKVLYIELYFSPSIVKDIKKNGINKNQVFDLFNKIIYVKPLD